LQRNEKGIWVLQATNMPAVLIETGFITNKEEEDYLNSDKGQEEMTTAIVTAVVNFKKMLDSSRNSASADTSATSAVAKPNPASAKEASTQNKSSKP